MKKISVYILTVAATFYLESCSTSQKTQVEEPKKEVEAPKEIKEEGLNISYMDKSVRPQDDFYNYVNGGWMKTAVLSWLSKLQAAILVWARFLSPKMVAKNGEPKKCRWRKSLFSLIPNLAL